MAEYYVSTHASASDANDGSDDSTNAFASPGKAGATAGDGDIINIKDGTYTLTSATPNANGGPVLIADGVHMEGYLSSPGDQLAYPIITAGAITSVNIVECLTPNFNGTVNSCFFIEVNGEGNSGVNGFDVAVNYNPRLWRCKALNCVVGFVGASANQIVSESLADGCSTYGYSNIRTLSCDATGCNVGYYRGETHDHSTSRNSTSHGFDPTTGFPNVYTNCVAYNNGGNGFGGSYDIAVCSKCISTSNSGYGYRIGTATGRPLCIDNASYNNTSGRFYNNQQFDLRQIILTGDPFNNAAAGDFSLNSTAGAGAACRGVEVTQINGTTSYFDLGVAQHQDIGGGGTTIIISKKTRIM